MRLLIIIGLLFSFSANAEDLSAYKAMCEEIGFKPKTTNFGNCVLKLRKKNLNKESSQETTKSYQNNTQEQQQIKNISNDLNRLKQQHQALAQRQFEATQRHNALLERQYNQQMAVYEQQKRKAEAERKRRQNNALMELGLRMMKGQTFTDSARATAGMEPIKPPAQPTLKFNEQYRVFLPNGSPFTCTYNPNFKRADCY